MGKGSTWILLGILIILVIILAVAASYALNSAVNLQGYSNVPQLKQAHTYMSWAGSIFWVIVGISIIAVLIILIGGGVLLFGSGVGEAAIAGAAVETSVLSATEISSIYKTSKNLFTSKKSLGIIFWIVLGCIILVSIVAIVCGVLSALGAYQINQVNSDDQKIANAYKSAVIAAVLALGSVILSFTYIIFFFVFRHLSKTKSRKMLADLAIGENIDNPDAFVAKVEAMSQPTPAAIENALTQTKLEEGKIRPRAPPGYSLPPPRRPSPSPQPVKEKSPSPPPSPQPVKAKSPPPPPSPQPVKAKSLPPSPPTPPSPPPSRPSSPPQSQPEKEITSPKSPPTSPRNLPTTNSYQKSPVYGPATAPRAPVIPTLTPPAATFVPLSALLRQVTVTAAPTIPTSSMFSFSGLSNLAKQGYGYWSQLAPETKTSVLSYIGIPSG